jgi:hypothetical protein
MGSGVSVVIASAKRKRGCADVTKPKPKPRKQLRVFDAPVPIPKAQSGWDGRVGWPGAPRPYFLPDPQLGAQRIGQIS